MASTERIIVDSVRTEERERRTSATVALRRGDDRVEASADGPDDALARWRIVADAALSALQVLEPAATRVAIESAGVQRIGDRELGIVTLVLSIGPDDELLAGVAPVRVGSEAEAVARAVLDATNRRLARLR